MGLSKAREAVSNTVSGDPETSSVATMPRGIDRVTNATERDLRTVALASLRSGCGSRSDVPLNDDSILELIASIGSLGIIEPIVVRQVGANAFTVVAGERRFAAAKFLKLGHVPCVVTNCSDDEALIISLTENLQRSDLDPVDKARALRRLLDEFALTQQEVGERVGMSQSAIAHHLRLLSLPEEVRCLISSGALSLGHGKVLAGIADAREAVAAAFDCVSKGQSVREFEAALSILRAKAEKRVPRGSVRNNREERELRNGLFLVIKESREQQGKGTIEIPFCSQEERNWVLKALSEDPTMHRASRSGADSATSVRVHKRPIASAHRVSVDN